jgi:hypothetical protein
LSLNHPLLGNPSLSWLEVAQISDDWTDGLTSNFTILCRKKVAQISDDWTGGGRNRRAESVMTGLAMSGLVMSGLVMTGPQSADTR